MHLLTAQAGGIEDGSQPVDLQQSPGDIVVLTSADTEIAGLSAACARLGNTAPTLRLANLLQLTNNFSVDLYIEQTLAKAKLIVVRVLGGPGYWQYGLDELSRLARGHGIKLAVVSGAGYPDDTLQGYATLPREICDRFWTYLVEGGAENFENFLRYGAHVIGDVSDVPPPPAPLPKMGAMHGGAAVSLDDLCTTWVADAPVVAITFYRALLQGGDTAPIQALAEALVAEGINPLPVYASSLKDPVVATQVADLFAELSVDAVINLTAFSISKPADVWGGTPLDSVGAPVFQAILAGTTESGWDENPRGLTARDIAMNVALPEIDGRILSRPISFKAERVYDDETQTSLVRHAPHADRIGFVARLVSNWVRLRRAKVGDRRVAVVLSNYPSTDGQIANGVGLDTPAGTLVLLKAMQGAGYVVDGLPDDGNALIAALQAGPTNAGCAGRVVRETLSRDSYVAAFDALPKMLQSEIAARWGPAEDDPFFDVGRDAFAIPAMRFGEIVVGVQPGRGQGLDAKEAHHDQTIVPPHGYVAFYAWMRQQYGAHAVIHMGKHGNLEWLPGKAMALSSSCYPEALFGPLPHIYPFIVNDPGEGTQAKRRTSAVIIDHMTPPLTRAESYGPLRDLEALVDEYYEAAGVDPRRIKLLGDRILDLASSTGLDKDCGIEREDCETEALTKLDNFLCDLKELQIRNGLHVFGESPSGDRLTDLIVALVRLPREAGKGRQASLIRAMAHDLGLESFDPLNCEMAETWDEVRPDALAALSTETWRTAGDTVERLELLAKALVAGEVTTDAAWTSTAEVMDEIEEVVRPRVEACGPQEISATLAALDGRFVPPGPSGAPTRGRLDVLPTGRNFFSLDGRTVPSEAAWTLGSASAELVVTAYRQDHGEWPKQVSISAWGTSNMRTGGDDIAQALAFIGVRPTWDNASRRITGYEMISLSELRRPRIDVMFRISGFFRDAFPSQIDLLDSAFRAVMALEEPEDANPLAARWKADQAELEADGMVAEQAATLSSSRIFGSRPGAYGAGLKDLIQNGQWQDKQELAVSYLDAGGYAYGVAKEGVSQHAQFSRRVGATDAVVQNQDAREFDILDSADFFQFEGGLATAAAHIKGEMPTIYHNDHSRPERPVVRSLEDELARTVRGRAANPKWIASVREHGYKGASEIAATVTNLFGFAATTEAVAGHHFEMLFEAYLVDPETRTFLEDNNPDALTELSTRFLDAIERGFWQPRRNSAYSYLISLTEEKHHGQERYDRGRNQRPTQGEDAQAQGAA